MIVHMNDIGYVKGFISPSKADLLFVDCMNHVAWSNSLITDEGQAKKIHRKMAYCYDEPVVYHYANLHLPSQQWRPDLMVLCSQLLVRLGIRTNSVLLNLYENGNDTINWHSDKEEILGDRPVIACINLGATRTFHFRHKESGDYRSYRVGNGDLLIMYEECQLNWMHAILKEEADGARISLTFRLVDPDKARQSQGPGSV